jgi:hypothetical protein
MKPRQVCAGDGRIGALLRDDGAREGIVAAAGASRVANTAIDRLLVSTIPQQAGMPSRNRSNAKALVQC